MPSDSRGRSAEVAPKAIRFVVPGKPIPQPRHRATLRKKKTAGKGIVLFPHHYISSKHPVHAYKHEVRLRGTRAKPRGWSKQGPMEVDVLFVLPRPSDMPDGPRQWVSSSSDDRDNLEKAVYDALTGEVWDDDGQICDGRTIRVYAASDEKPHTVVAVRPKLTMMPGIGDVI